MFPKIITRLYDENRVETVFSNKKSSKASEILDDLNAVHTKFGATDYRRIY